MRSIRLVTLGVLFISATLTACDAGTANQASKAANANKAPASAQSANSTSNISYGSSNTTASNTATDSVDKASIERKAAPPQAKSEPPPKVIDRKVIRNADLTLEAESPEESQQKITAIAESRGGFVVESTQRSSSTDVSSRDIVTMSLRIPSEKFNESLEEIRKTSSRIVQETVSGQDVTEEFIDLEARIKTKKALEQQYLDIMKRASSIDETMDIQARIANVRTEIEQIEGRARFLENQSSLSNIRVEIQSPTALANSTGFFHQLKGAFGSGLGVAVSFILFLVQAIVALLPFLVLVVLPIILVLRYLLKKRKTERTAGEIAREEIKEE